MKCQVKGDRGWGHVSRAKIAMLDETSVDMARCFA
jgi:hypothetical protein